MAEYRYEWELILAGHGKNRQEAWEYLVDSVVADGLGDAPEPIYRNMEDPDYEPDEPLDETPIKKRPVDCDWLIWSNEHRSWWAPARQGYVKLRSKAGRYPFIEAVQIVTDANRYLHTSEDPHEAMILAED